MKKGLTEIEVTNYYDDSILVIPLNPQKTPTENAQKYFSKYQKAKNSIQLFKNKLKRQKLN